MFTRRTIHQKRPYQFQIRATEVGDAMYRSCVEQLKASHNR